MGPSIVSRDVHVGFLEDRSRKANMLLVLVKKHESHNRSHSLVFRGQSLFMDRQSRHSAE